MDGRPAEWPIHTDDWATKLHLGDLGTVDIDPTIDDQGVVRIHRDNGERLGPIPDVDQWEVIEGGMSDGASPG